MLDKHGRIRVSVQMRGRENQRPELAVNVINVFAEGIPNAAIDNQPTVHGNMVSVVMSRKQKKA